MELIDLTDRLSGDRTTWTGRDFDWQELAGLWDNNRLQEAHDWLTARWMHLVRTRPGGQADPDAQLLQGLAFAVNALFFTQQANQEGALLMLDDALLLLGRFRPAFLGVSLEPIVDTLQTLRPTIVTLGPDDVFPGQLFVYRKFALATSNPCLLS